MNAYERQLLQVNGITLSLYSTALEQGPVVWLLHGIPMLGCPSTSQRFAASRPWQRPGPQNL